MFKTAFISAVFAGYVAAMFGLASIPKSPTAEVSSIESTAAAN